MQWATGGCTHWQSSQRARAKIPHSRYLRKAWGVMVALPVKLAGTGELESSLNVFGNDLVEQRTLWVARVVEFEFGV